MRCRVAGVVGVLVLGCATGVGWADTPPPVELPMPAPETAFATSPPPPRAPTEPGASAALPGHSRCGPRILGYGYDPARGIVTFTVHDAPPPLAWAGYTGHGRVPEWLARCRGRACDLCGRRPPSPALP